MSHNGGNDGNFDMHTLTRKKKYKEKKKTHERLKQMERE